MKSNIVGLAGLLALFGGLCIGGILSGSAKSRELSWVAIASVAGVVVLAVLIVLG
jgi:hypothetical protein